MQVRAGGPAGSAHQAKVVALLYALAAAHVDAAQVRVYRRGIAAMFHYHDIAIATLHTCKIYHAIGHGAHRGAGHCAVIHA